MQPKLHFSQNVNACILLECLTAACKAFSLANAMGEGIDELGDQVFR
jgi:hypothetical protein